MFLLLVPYSLSFLLATLANCFVTNAFIAFAFFLFLAVVVVVAVVAVVVLLVAVVVESLLVATALPGELELLALGVACISTTSLGVDEDGVAVIVEIGVLVLDTEEVGVVYIAW